MRIKFITKSGVIFTTIITGDLFVAMKKLEKRYDILKFISIEKL